MMVYCTWKSEGGKSDVYCYFSWGLMQYCIHLTDRKSLSYDNEALFFDKEDEMHEKLTELQELGYYVPREAFKKITLRR